ncbi:MAG TPA: cobalamin-binding protein [Bryobacteraceae bacterium]|jgi:iron complex transport system substrate-binding protein|nr:cobalamin-binding protein [Bryobacteraceae bacterium]
MTSWLARLLLYVMACATLCAQPKRIVSTAPSITETLFALGLGDRVVGVTNYCTYPPEAQKIAKIGSFAQPNLEAILAMRPDLVIIHKTAVHSREQYAAIRLNVVEVQSVNITNILDSIRTIGKAAGVERRGQELAASIEKELADIQQRVAGKPKTSVMYIVGRSPNAIEGLVAVGGGAYLNELMERAGGSNIFKDARADYIKVSLEEVLARNPEVIIDLGDMAEPERITEAHKKQVQALWSRYPSLRAVKSKRIHPVASNIYVVPGPRLVLAAREFGRLLHPELFH